MMSNMYKLASQMAIAVLIGVKKIADEILIDMVWKQ